MGTSRDHRTTEQLVLRIHGGDLDAFNQLFMRYYPRIKLLVRLHMLDKLKAQVEADDVIQEIYMEVYRNFHKFEYRDPDSFYKWVIKVIGWKIKDFDKYFFKTAKRQPADTLSLQQHAPGASTDTGPVIAEGLAGAGSTPSAIIMEKEGYKMLAKALQRLPGHFRKVIQLRHLEQRSVKETAEILEMKPNAVNVLFHRAQTRLHEVLKEMSYFKA